MNQNIDTNTLSLYLLQTSCDLQAGAESGYNPFGGIERFLCKCREVAPFEFGPFGPPDEGQGKAFGSDPQTVWAAAKGTEDTTRIENLLGGRQLLK